MSTDIDVKAADALEKLETLQRVCEPCVTEKSHKVQNRIAHTRATEKDELIHTDLVDDELISTFIEKAKFVIIMIDDYTNFTTVYLLDRKSELKAVLRNYFEFMRIQNTFVRRLRFDKKEKYVNIKT